MRRLLTPLLAALALIGPGAAGAATDQRQDGPKVTALTGRINHTVEGEVAAEGDAAEDPGTGRGRSTPAYYAIVPTLVTASDGSRCVRKLRYRFNDPLDRKSTRLNSSHIQKSRMPSSA